MIGIHYNINQDFTESQNWMQYDPGFTKEELEKIESDLKDIDFIEAETFGGKQGMKQAKNDEQRRSRIKWVPQDAKFGWIYGKLLDMAKDANSKLWKFDLHSMPEMIQYTEYDASEKGHYDWHQDIGPGIGSVRKISMTVQLSAPEEYEGGVLEYYVGGPLDGEGHTKLIKSQGSVLVFPSYMPHRVTPVTKGIRKSFVLWLGGSSYK
mgnify:CR=1 FL=1